MGGAFLSEEGTMTDRSIFSCPAGSDNYFDPATGICWHIGRQWCRSDHKGHRSFFFGRCRSGQRWFWVAHHWRIGQEYQDKAEGWEETEQAAEAAVRAAIIRMAEGEPASATLSHGSASERLKEINKLKRQQRPPSNSKDSNRVEYLYGHSFGGEDTPGHPVRFRITRRTKKRIFYIRPGEDIDRHGVPIDYSQCGIQILGPSEEKVAFVDRQKLEADGHVYSRSRGWWCDDFHLHISLEHLLASIYRYRDQQNKPEDLLQLKAEMAAAHPDRGGSSAAFIEARERYIAARIRSERRSSHD
jgi:hypothetical protein